MICLKYTQFLLFWFLRLWLKPTDRYTRFCEKSLQKVQVQTPQSPPSGPGIDLTKDPWSDWPRMFGLTMSWRCEANENWCWVLRCQGYTKIVYTNLHTYWSHSSWSEILKAYIMSWRWYCGLIYSGESDRDVLNSNLSLFNESYGLWSLFWFS